MSMNGLFAYADKDSPNTIKLISIDDIIANVQKNDIIDWSDRVILNDFHRVDMPDASISPSMTSPKATSSTTTTTTM